MRVFDRNIIEDYNGIKIEYGIKYGNDNVLFIKTGLNGQSMDIMINIIKSS